MDAYNFRCTSWYGEDNLDRMDYFPNWLNDTGQGVACGSQLHKAFWYGIIPLGYLQQIYFGVPVLPWTV